MSPSERAADLIAKFSPHVEIHKWDGKNESHKDEYHYSPIKSVANAKACAIICCDEIEKYVPYTHRDPEGSLENIRAYETSFVTYWDSVKAEIQKL